MRLMYRSDLRELFDDRVGAHKQRVRQGEAEHLCHCEIELVRRHLLYRKVSGLSTSEDPVNRPRTASGFFLQISGIGKQTA
jgi:hypothetical protein